MNRTFLALGTLGALASCQSSHPRAGTAGAAAATAARTSGRDSITAADLRADVERLAADDMGGRGTLEPGLDKAGDVIAGRFEELGLVPLPGHQDVRVAYDLYEYGFDPDRTRVALTTGGATTELALGVDYTPFAFTDSGAVEAEVVFAGYGITAPELGWDDYDGLDVKGKVVLLLRHHPNEDRKDGNFDGARYGAFTNKAITAAKHGAVGMILVTDRKHHRDAEDFRVRSLHTISKLERDKGDDKDGAMPLFLAAHVSQAAAARLVGGDDALLALQDRVDAGARPRELAIPRVTATLSITMLEEPRIVRPRNVIGVLPGADPALRDQWVVIGAHYDHLGSYAGDGDTVYNGADDNASGTSGLLALARAFASRPDRPARTIVFMAFSGEEMGLLGSRAALDQSIVPADKIVFMLNLDMIGRNEDRPVEVVGDAYGTDLGPALQRANADVGLPIELGGTNYAGNSDHHPFYERDIPFMFFFTGTHEDYHQLTDHADKLAYARMEQIVRVAYGLIDQIAAGGVTPQFIHHVSWLGVRIQTVDGAAVITGVDAGSRAERAGFRAGDAIAAIAGEPLASPREVGARLRAQKPGTTFELVVRRDGGEHRAQIERAQRGYLGVFPDEPTDDERKAHGLAADEGVKIRGVPEGGPAAAAGVREGDILIRIAGEKVGIRTLGRILARIGAGETVAIVVIRDGQRLTLQITLAGPPERPRP